MPFRTLLVVVLADIVLYLRAALCITPADILASNRAVYCLLAPGGRVVGARHVCSDVLSLGVAQASQKACSAAFAVHHAEVIIEEGLSLLECSDGDDLDGWLSEIMGQTCRELKTRGDGFCGIHATFGHCDPFRHELRHESPNDVLRSCFAHPLDDIRRSVRLEHMGLVDSVVSALWSDFCGSLLST